MPKTRIEFWQGKFDRNVERDGQTLTGLEALNWRAEVVWECETKDTASLDRRLRAIFGLAPRIGPEVADDGETASSNDR
jgi:DNA mismatch endonuclease (patch repair protein)